MVQIEDQSKRRYFLGDGVQSEKFHSLHSRRYGWILAFLLTGQFLWVLSGGFLMAQEHPPESLESGSELSVHGFDSSGVSPGVAKAVWCRWIWRNWRSCSKR